LIALALAYNVNDTHTHDMQGYYWPCTVLYAIQSKWYERLRRNWQCCCGIELHSLSCGENIRFGSCSCSGNLCFLLGTV